MSADLFAEFGSGNFNQSSGTAYKPSEQPQTNSLIPRIESFEDAPPPSRLNASTPHTTQPRTLPTRLAYSGQHDIPPLPQYGNNSDVLFDATTETPSDNESDDWGEFETAEVPSQGPSTNFDQGQRSVSNPMTKISNSPKSSSGLPKQLDLLDSLSIEDTAPSNYRQPTTSLANKTSKPPIKEALPITSSIPAEEEEPFEEWGDFIDGPSTESPQTKPLRPAYDSKSPVQNPAPAKNIEQKLPTSFGNSSHTVHTAQVRPTNIPPPSVLLELFPQLFETMRQEATTARRNIQQKEPLEMVALMLLCTLKAAARVVAGRTLRWKRDSILSQSMKIGPARSGKPGGMKLNTVNKNEDIKEQQEAVDVIAMWRDRTALFNSVIQASGRRPIHVISETIRVTTATAEQGAIKASHACALCGLKREERLPKIDENVEDSFGEWWTDHWGHTDCRQFWEKYMNLLGQR